MKKTLRALAALVLLLACTGQALAAGLDNFKTSRVYTDDTFSDVDSGDWYSESVRFVYESGLMNGTGDGLFSPRNKLTMAQVIAIAARIHRIYTAGEDDLVQGRVWYDVYVRYAEENGLIDDRNACLWAATRANFTRVLSRALPASALAAVNEVEDGAIPDVELTSDYAESVYLLYRAGVLTGSDSHGSFHPDESISRAEAAAIVSRMLDPTLRKSFTLRKGPDVFERARQEDDFFADAAILGNSLVDGLRIFSQMKSLDYFCATSVSVMSAMNSKSTTLNNGMKGTLVEALCQKQYGKIYIELGINEIGYDVSYFIQLYGDMLDAIRAQEPEADIYIVGILPVTAKKAAERGTVFTMERVRGYNEALYALAEEKGCYYLDVCSAFCGEDGFLPADWSSDGVHLQGAYYAVWEEYMRTHYA